MMVEINRYMSWFYKNEICNTGKLFARILHVLKPKAEEGFILLCVYTRKIDLLVDGGKDIPEIVRLLNKQMYYLHSLMNGDKIYSNDELYLILLWLKNRYSKEIFKILIVFIEGAFIEIEIIRSRKPPSLTVLNERHLSQTKLCIQLINICVNKTKLSDHCVIDKLMISWAEYDCLMDVEEDFNAGLILFSVDELHNFNVLVSKNIFNKTHFNRFLNAKKYKVVLSLCKYSFSIYKTNLPISQKATFQLYYFSRAMKLFYKKITISSSKQKFGAITIS